MFYQPSVDTEPVYKCFINLLPRPKGSMYAYLDKAGKPQCAHREEGVKWKKSAMTSLVRAKSANWTPIDKPCGIWCQFHFLRPAKHFEAGGKGPLKADAPMVRDGDPDTDKLMRATYDALEAARVVTNDAVFAKCYAERLFCCDTYHGNMENVHFAMPPCIGTRIGIWVL